jgi:hypothetical protein
VDDEDREAVGRGVRGLLLLLSLLLLLPLIDKSVGIDDGLLLLLFGLFARVVAVVRFDAFASLLLLLLLLLGAAPFLAPPPTLTEAPRPRVCLRLPSLGSLASALASVSASEFVSS